MWHVDMFVTLKVFKLIGPSNDGRRHGRGTYLFFIFRIFQAFWTTDLPRYTPKKRTIKKLCCIGEKHYVLLCPPLQTAPPTGEAAKLTDDVKQITSYKSGTYRQKRGYNGSKKNQKSNLEQRFRAVYLMEIWELSTKPTQRKISDKNIKSWLSGLIKASVFSLSYSSLWMNIQTKSDYLSLFRPDKIGYVVEFRVLQGWQVI
jgi:hypothetical protein